MDKVDQVVEKVVNEFQTKPIATTLKGVLILWVLRELKKWWDKS